MKNKKVLLVEDIEFNRYICGELLEQMGVEVDEAANGSEALKKLRAESYDLVLMDLHMPDVNGTDVIRQHRAERLDGTRPIFVALSAHATPEIEAGCAAAGFDYFHEKPLNPERLRRILAQHPALPPANPAPGTDNSSFLDYLAQGDPCRRVDIERRYIQTALNHLKALRTALTQNQSAETQAIIHKLKGVASFKNRQCCQKLLDDLQGANTRGETASPETMGLCDALEGAITSGSQRSPAEK